MKFYNVAVSKYAPNCKNCLWAKPVDNGFVMYMLDGGMWKPLQLVNPKGTPAIIDDVLMDSSYIAEAVGSFN